MTTVDIKKIINIAEQAGQLVMNIYHQPACEGQNKNDTSPLTQADLASHDFIVSSLQQLYSSTPIISEESANQYKYGIRKNWKSFFLVDPLDGTKEFIQRNGEFTINIALIQKNLPILGVIHAPAYGITYYAEQGKGAYKLSNNTLTQLSSQTNHRTDHSVCVVISRSHTCEKTRLFIDKLRAQGKNVSVTISGSAIKFGLVAEGSADLYPRFSTTMEWDTAAGYILIKESGYEMVTADHANSLQYNQPELHHSDFIVQLKNVGF